MSEVQEATKQAPKIVSAGKPMKADFTSPLAQHQQANPDNGEQGGQKSPEDKEKESSAAKLEGTSETPEEKAIREAKELEDKNKPAALIEPKPLTDEELKAEYEKRFPPTTELTEEQKLKKEQAFEKRMLDLYVESGGKIEEFTLLKQVAAADLTELSKSELTAELKKAGFNETEIAAIQKERYYQLTEDDLEQLPDETEKEFAKRKIEYGKQKLENRSAHKKTQAQSFLNTLRQAITEQDLQSQKESEFVSNVDAHFDKLERKMALQLGKVDDTDIAPVEYEVPESAIAETKETLRDSAKRKQLLYNEDGSLNLTNISEILLKAKMFESAVKTGYLEGGSRQVAEFEKIFPNRSAHEVGIGSGQKPKDGVKGKIVSAGKPVRFNQAVN